MLIIFAAAAAVVGLSSVVVAPAAAAPAGEVPRFVVGGWRPIKDVSDPHIQELGRWAVLEYVKRANDGLAFVKVVRGEEQVVAGTNYRLVIEATNGAGKSAAYVAVVYEALSTARKLLSFGPAN